MKQLLFLCCLVAQLSSFAQTFAVKTGLALCTYSAAYGDGYRSPSTQATLTTAVKPGFIFGVSADLVLNKNLFFRPGVELVTKGAVENVHIIDNGNTYQYRSSRNFAAIDVPLNLVYKKGAAGNPRFVFGGGIVPGFLVKSELRKADFGVDVLAGYELPIGISFTANYVHGLLNVAATPYSYQSLRNRYLGITLGYFF